MRGFYWPKIIKNKDLHSKTKSPRVSQLKIDVWTGLDITCVFIQKNHGRIFKECQKSLWEISYMSKSHQKRFWRKENQYTGLNMLHCLTGHGMLRFHQWQLSFIENLSKLASCTAIPLQTTLVSNTPVIKMAPVCLCLALWKICYLKWAICEFQNIHKQPQCTTAQAQCVLCSLLQASIHILPSGHYKAWHVHSYQCTSGP